MRRIEQLQDRSIPLPRDDYEVVASIVLYKTARAEVERAIRLFLAVPLRAHLCIIDNSPKPVTFAAPGSDSISYYFANQNLGYGRGHNIALRAAAHTSQYSLVMNTDIEYDADVVVRLKGFLDANPRAGLAAPRVEYPDGRLQYVCRLLPTPKNFFLRRFLPRSDWARRVDYDYELRAWDHTTVENLPYFQGSYLMMRSALCGELGGFDERFFLYGEDIDLSRRLHAVSETLYVPDVAITHEYRRFSSRGLRGTLVGIANNARYFNKWGWFFDVERRRINARVRVALARRSGTASG